jgi:hypothetical protein
VKEHDRIIQSLTRKNKQKEIIFFEDSHSSTGQALLPSVELFGLFSTVQKEWFSGYHFITIEVNVLTKIVGALKINLIQKH